MGERISYDQIVQEEKQRGGIDFLAVLILLIPALLVPLAHFISNWPVFPKLSADEVIGFIIKFSILFLIAILFSLIIGAALTLLIRGFLLSSLAGKIIVGVISFAVVVGLFFCTKYYLREN